LLPAFDSGEDALWVGGPDEGFGIGVCLSDKAVDSGLKVNDGSEHAALEATARDVDDNSCSHAESLNCFGRFGNLRMNQTTSSPRYKLFSCLDPYD
jgi:hypothetical protein